MLPGTARVDLEAVRLLFEGTYVAFAAREVAERLSGSMSGTVLPFSFSPKLELIADPSLAERETLYFNAARLDRSIALAASDYFRIARPRIERIAMQQRPRAPTRRALSRACNRGDVGLGKSHPSGNLAPGPRSPLQLIPFAIEPL